MLKSWKVIAKTAIPKSGTDGWGGTHHYYPWKAFYVVAKTKKSAMYQAKIMAGYTKEEAEKKSSIDKVEMISELQCPLAQLVER